MLITPRRGWLYERNFHVSPPAYPSHPPRRVLGCSARRTLVPTYSAFSSGLLLDRRDTSEKAATPEANARTIGNTKLGS